MVVDAGGAHVRVAEPFLHLGDVGALVERIGGGRRARRVRAEALHGDTDASRMAL